MSKHQRTLSAQFDTVEFYIDALKIQVKKEPSNSNQYDTYEWIPHEWLTYEESHDEPPPDGG